MTDLLIDKEAENIRPYDIIVGREDLTPMEIAVTSVRTYKDPAIADVVVQGVVITAPEYRPVTAVFEFGQIVAVLPAAGTI